MWLLLCFACPWLGLYHIPIIPYYHIQLLELDLDRDRDSDLFELDCCVSSVQFKCISDSGITPYFITIIVNAAEACYV